MTSSWASEIGEHTLLGKLVARFMMVHAMHDVVSCDACIAWRSEAEREVSLRLLVWCPVGSRGLSQRAHIVDIVAL